MEAVRRLLPVLAVSLALAPAAQAATVATDKQCYKGGERISVNGAGYTAGGTYTANVNGQQLPNGTGTVRPDGGFSGGFTAPILNTSSERSFTFGASDGVNSALTTYKVAPFSAVFSPSSGNPRSLRVRFRTYGFTAGARVYLHITRSGRVKDSRYIGRQPADCSALVSKKFKLFPFKTSAGSYSLQYDTNKKYSISNPGKFLDTVVITRRFR